MQHDNELVALAHQLKHKRLALRALQTNIAHPEVARRLLDNDRARVRAALAMYRRTQRSIDNAHDALARIERDIAALKRKLKVAALVAQAQRLQATLATIDRVNH